MQIIGYQIDPKWKVLKRGKSKDVQYIINKYPVFEIIAQHSEYLYFKLWKSQLTTWLFEIIRTKMIHKETRYLIVINNSKKFDWTNSNGLARRILTIAKNRDPL